VRERETREGIKRFKWRWYEGRDLQDREKEWDIFF
jgi:hypothetical protein